MRLWNRIMVSAMAGALVSAALVLNSDLPAIAASTCAGLSSLSLTDGTVTSATDITAPYTTTASSGPATITVSAPFPFCRVEATLTPTADSDIRMEIWLPAADNWNGKFLGVGNGALTGAIWHTSMVRPLQSGYAVANSDLGHQISTANWALGHPEKVVDYAYRADHVTAVAAKAIVAAFYGGGPRLSYFHGCSNGGHQALMEAQRYPDDYDGIIAGAPWNQWTHQNVEFIWRALNLPEVTAAKLPMITAAVVAQCGAREGGFVGDGYLNDPRDCGFSPRTLQCQGADAPTCLTAQEVQAVEELYEGPSNPDTHQSLFPGFERGSEFGWVAFGAFVNNLFQNMVFENNPTWDYHTFNFTSDVAFFDAKLASTIDSNSPDLRPFRERGGRIIMWQGWTDTTLEPRNSVNYYNSVVAVTGGGLDVANPGERDGRGADGRRDALEDTQAFFRHFMAPGVNHCGGGQGPNSSFAYTLGNTAGPNDPDHDILAALDRWVEHGTAPNQLIASHFTNGIADKTRPICAYPKVARYRGTGDPNDPGSFVCLSDWDDFDRDYSRELANIASDVRLHDLDNLPNGGFVDRHGSNPSGQNGNAQGR
jgi:feruloyl esterase